MDIINKRCEMRTCRGESLRVGRHIAELLTKTSEIPINNITADDLKTLGGRLNNIVNYCSIKDEDNKKISSLYAELLASQKSLDGRKMANNLIELTKAIYYSNDDCKCQKEETED